MTDDDDGAFPCTPDDDDDVTTSAAGVVGIATAPPAPPTGTVAGPPLRRLRAVRLRFVRTGQSPHMTWQLPAGAETGGGGNFAVLT